MKKKKPRDKVIRDEARRFAQTELKFTIPNEIPEIWGYPIIYNIL